MTNKSIAKFIAVVIFIVLAIGYVKGVVKLVQCDFKPSYKAEIIYSVGVISGLNGVLGWIDFGK